MLRNVQNITSEEPDARDIETEALLAGTNELAKHETTPPNQNVSSRDMMQWPLENDTEEKTKHYGVRQSRKKCL